MVVAAADFLTPDIVRVCCSFSILVLNACKRNFDVVFYEEMESL